MRQQLRRSIPGGLLALFFLLSGCETTDPDYQPDPGDDDDDDTTTDACIPEIDSLELSRGTEAALGVYLTLSFTYDLNCDAEVVDGEVQLQVTNMDADDPDAEEASAWYFLPIPDSSSGQEVQYVFVDEDEQTVKVDFASIDESTTYRFRVKLKDSEGRRSNQLEKATSYIDLPDESSE